MRTTSLLLVVSFLTLVVAFDREARAAETATTPATAPAPPHKIVIPPGFKTVTVNGRNVICEASDEPWVATALGKIQATTKPATLPASMLQRATEQRTVLLQQLAKDLALTDLTSAAATYDKELVAELRDLDEYRPKTFYLCATPERVAELMRGGWSDPHFYYNRVADAVTFNPMGVLATERPQDDVLFPAAYDSKDTPDKRGEQLSIAIGGMEAQIQRALEIKAHSTVGGMFAQLVVDQGIKALDLKPDQEWFGLGVSAILSAKYAGVITNESAESLMDMLTQELPQNPLKASAIDLIRPPDVASMRDEALPAYYDTLRRKSARAVRFLATKGGEQAIPKSIVLIKSKKPADGAALVKVIQDATTVDLTPQVSKGT